MEIQFKQFKEVTHYDSVLRNAIWLDCIELAQQSLSKGANINCRYADDWNTPLHLAINNRCRLEVINELMSHKPDYSLVNGDNLTACEVALRDGLEELARRLIIEEFGKVQDPTDAIYAMLKRNSAEALEMLIDGLNLSDCALAGCLSMTWNKLEVMNVVLNPAVKVFVHSLLIRLEYDSAFNRKHCGDSPGVMEEQMRMVIAEIEYLEKKYDTGLCHDVTDEFLELLRLILKYLFVLKNKVNNFPAMQLEYCLAIYLAIFDRKPELDQYQLVVNKRLIIEFLKLFKSWYKHPSDDQRMSCELLFNLVKYMEANAEEKCEQIILSWKLIAKSTYTKRELVLIRNKTLKCKQLRSLSSDKLKECTESEWNVLKNESDNINRMFENKKSKRQNKNLIKTFYRLKQMYSLQKSIHYLSVVQNLELNPDRCCYSEMLTIQRIIQVLGETLKSTKLSPNISSNMKSILDFVSPDNLLKWVSKLRQYFSHNYSATKHTFYRRLRVNDTEMIIFFKRVKNDLLKLVPLISNIYTDFLYRCFKSFLGNTLKMQSVEHIRSYAEASRVRPGFKVDCYFQSCGLREIRSKLTELQQSFDPERHSSSLEILTKISSKIDVYEEYLENRSINFMTDMVLGCIGELIICNDLQYQKNLAHFYLGHFSSPKEGGFGAIKFLLLRCNPLLRDLLALEARIADTTSHRRAEMIQNFLKMGNVEDIQQLYDLTLLKDTTSSQSICNTLVADSLSQAQSLELHKKLRKYYDNLFSIDDKYRVVKTFCKSNKLKYKADAAVQCRKKDINECQDVIKDLISDLNEIVSLPENMKTSKLVSLISSCGVYNIDKVELFALETILLELLEILSSQDVLTDNRFMMTSFRSVVTGRNLRNYLAHDGLVYETICRNESPVLTILLNAICLTKYCNVELYSKSKQTDNKEAQYTGSKTHEWIKTCINEKTNVFVNIEKGNFDLLTSKDIELGARDYNKRSVLMALIDNHSEQMIRLLLERPSTIRSLIDALIQRMPNQNHNFYDDDEFTLAQLINQQSIRESMSFYLAMKYHHFDLEQELNVLHGGAYSKDSLHMAIIFKNEKSALSIINDEHLYSICKDEAWNFRNTVLFHAVLHKLPNVVRRICEVSPELIERTNTNQETPLRIAIAGSCKEIVEILLEFGARIFTIEKPSIIYALQVRKDDLLETLIPSEEELIKDEELLNRLVVYSSSSNYTILLNRLLPIVKRRSTLIESLGWAVQNNQLDAVQVLLNFDVTLVNEVSEFETTALFRACYLGLDKIVAVLLERGADVNYTKEISPLQCTIDTNRHKQFKMMIQRGIGEPDLINHMFQDLYSLSRYSWVWTLLHAGYSCDKDIVKSSVKNIIDHSTLEFLFKLIRFKRELIQHINTHTLANAILLKKFEFVKYVLERLDDWSGLDRTRLLNYAVKANDKDMVQLLVEHGCSVNSSDANGITPLATAVSIGKSDMVRELIMVGADPNLESMEHCDQLLDVWNMVCDNIDDLPGGKYYRTYPLILAAKNSSSKTAVYLLKHGSDADVSDQSGLTALVVAMSFGDEELVDALIRHGASVDYVRNYSHPFFKDGNALHCAATYGHLDMITRMVGEFGFNYMATDSDGNTVLHLAAMKGNANIVNYFLHDNIWHQINKNGDTPLMLALKHLDLTVFRVIKGLKTCEKEVNQFRGTANRTLLHEAVLKEDITLVQILLKEFDIDIYWADNSGYTAVHYAVRRKNYDLVKLLVEAGTSLTGPSEHNTMPPFVIAVLTNQLNIVQLYFEKERNAINHVRNHRYDGKNLLISSILLNNFAMCKLLQEKVQFDLNESYENGYTALHAAATSNSVRTIDFLVNRGSKIDLISEDNKTALILAIEYGNFRVAHYLLTEGASKQTVTDYRLKVDDANLLHLMASKGQLNSLRFLLDRAFFTRTDTDAIGRTIGHFAAFNKQHDVIEYLIASQFPFDQLDNEGRSCLVYALENEDLRLAKRLKSIGSSLEIVQLYCEKNNFLVRALNNKKIKLMKFLIKECYVKVESSIEHVLIGLSQSNSNNAASIVESETSQSNNEPENSALIGHFINGNLTFAENLIDDVASLEELKNYRTTNRDKETILHVVVRNDCLSILRLLLTKGVFDIDVGDVDQTTALQVAAMLGRKECVDLLLQFGANVDFEDLQKTTALTRACINSQKDIADILLSHGASAENTKAYSFAERDGATSLHIAVLGDLSLVELLVRNFGMDVNVVDTCGRTSLHIASQKGSIEAVELLLKLGARSDIIDRDGKTPFVTALVSGFEEVAERILAETQDVEYLRHFRMPQTLKSILHIALDRKFTHLLLLLRNDYRLDCSSTDIEGKSILHYVVADGNESLLKQLQPDADMFFLEDNFGKTPLSMSTEQSNVDIFMTLIQSLAESATLNQLISIFEKLSKLEATQFVNLYARWLLDNKKSSIAKNQQFAGVITRTYTTDPFLHAIHGDHIDLVELFLECGVVRSFEFDATTWLHVAALKGVIPFVKVMLEEFKLPVSCVDNLDKTPLCYAVAMRHTKTAQYLLERGADVNFRDKFKRTPLQTALENNHTEMVQLLLKYHASISLLQEFRYQNDNEHLVQHYLAERGLTEALALIISEIDISHGDKFGMTPLHYAAGCNQLEVIDMLVKAGAAIDCLDIHKTTPLMRALSKNHLKAYNMLVGFGANVELLLMFQDTDFDGGSILHITAEKNRMEATKLLVEDLKCDIDCVDKNGNTPLHCAIQKECFEIVKYLLQKNASLHLKNSNGQTSLQLLEAVSYDVDSTTGVQLCNK
ncbi:uncharacterized protein LOC134211228 [Armigeres subalbatus]|uniref:uncharacterized protein LOC134211228 n=1 Tax=Armigeres subalbatus TaxID=124917 RepID=UPI002ED4A270